MTDPARHNAAQRAYYEQRESPRMLPRDTPYVRRHVDEVVRFAKLTPADRIVDVGCGLGRYTLPLAERGLRVEGLDLSPVLLERLRGFDGGRFGIPVHAADVSDPPAELEGAFDAVVGFFALHHMHDLDLAFRGLVRLLRPGGRLVFLEPNAWNPLYYLQIAFTSMTWAGDGGIVRMRRSVVGPALEAAGFERLRVERFGFFPPVLANHALGRRIERGLERLRPLEPVLPFQLFGAERPAAA